MAGELWEQGLKELRHFQPAAYYKQCFAAAAEGCNVKVPLLEMQMGPITCDAGGTEDDLPMLPAEAPPEAAPSARRPPAMPRLVRTLLDGGHTDDWPEPVGSELGIFAFDDEHDVPAELPPGLEAAVSS